MITRDRNHGYIPDIIQREDYVFGARPTGKVLRPDRNWLTALPVFEQQSRGTLESMNCTNYSTINALETLLKAQHGITANYSERYTGVLTGTTEYGNSPHNVVEKMRRFTGMIPEERLPFNDSIKTWEQYYSGVGVSHMAEGIAWLWKWKITHEWVEEAGMKDALLFSPLGVAVQAWTKDGELYVRTGQDTHWCLIYGYRDKEYWLVYDTYDSMFKKLEWNYGFTRVKRYAITQRKAPAPKDIGRMLTGFISNL